MLSAHLTGQLREYLVGFEVKPGWSNELHQNLHFLGGWKSSSLLWTLQWSSKWFSSHLGQEERQAGKDSSNLVFTPSTPVRSPAIIFSFAQAWRLEHYQIVLYWHVNHKTLGIPYCSTFLLYHTSPCLKKTGLIIFVLASIILSNIKHPNQIAWLFFLISSSDGLQCKTMLLYLVTLPTLTPINFPSLLTATTLEPSFKALMYMLFSQEVLAKVMPKDL